MKNMYKINWTPEKEKKAIEVLTKYFEKHGVGECIMQSDDAIIRAPELMAEIADKVLKEGKGIVYVEPSDR